MSIRDKKRENDEIMGKMKQEIRSLESMVARLDEELDLKKGQKDVLPNNREPQVVANKNSAVGGTDANVLKIEKDLHKMNANRERLPRVLVKHGETFAGVPVKHGDRLAGIPVKQSSIRDLVSSSRAQVSTFDDMMAISELDTSDEI